MVEKSITSTEFQARVGAYIDEAAKGPVFIRKHKRLARVLLDIDEYERLKQYDTRQSFHPKELSADLLVELKGAEVDPRHDHLDQLMKPK
ncbi:MAG: type II toxin-antitoxin system Phd/YefM family antitoxin [Rhodospirillaceae bacterium]|nr:type II toxin-antitoxin system Phd/YefM family antitoxin [Rhodospirillaceae bacterium]MBT4046061.1 type II toxin-antitoxin system Phd/YefM family antitoxin [Rhodospirillaceae bacterium]MBT4688118.1 type II toxin-antitoxin system Phd/YefM family antitoxin [Rhodospirillaceae bacterium]MBT5080285.1 type II toxin-antitoxin system Phd/YefM family antitoxin [Rhodospirillaceae bacterium]MBT5525016.1 type II toxin-antitoxin system Phd/YefM family antitoxin [Rhodospirillaceae bacterium]